MAADPTDTHAQRRPHCPAESHTAKRLVSTWQRASGSVRRRGIRTKEVVDGFRIGPEIGNFSATRPTDPYDQFDVSPYPAIEGDGTRTRNHRIGSRVFVRLCLVSKGLIIKDLR